MSTYVVGDVQGCLDALYGLLEKVNFDFQEDHLWVIGDLVNRGPDSLATLRFLKQLPNGNMVLGNHDLHLLAFARGLREPNKKDTLAPILEAEDRDELLNWLQHRPLVHHDTHFKCTMVHAGIPPIWSVEKALSLAKEVETVLRSEHSEHFFRNMYGNQPSVWRDDLEGSSRLRVITNYFTRMRFCSAEGILDLSTKTGPLTAPEGYLPWFEHPHHACNDNTILFGHWAALEGECSHENFFALDTGCVWGGKLSALRLDDKTLHSVECDCA